MKLISQKNIFFLVICQSLLMVLVAMLIALAITQLKLFEETYKSESMSLRNLDGERFNKSKATELKTSYILYC